MQILSVALTNFKTHKEQQFHFQLGTNAICGENGAGKTSILEAIAWVLFNYQGSYRKEDLIRNGASSAQARVAFISSRDNRTYEVQRSTTGGYTLYDPQLGEKLPYTRTKDEVLPWLRQHLGVAPGTDLGQLFANTIGVPQGTFTADFLLSAEKRKPIFDTILKVEEYREAFRQSNSLRKYAEAQVERLKDLVEQYEEALKSWDEMQNRYQQLQQEIEQGESQLTRLEEQKKAVAECRQVLAEKAQQVQQAQAQQQAITHQLTAQKQTQTQIEAMLGQARQAATICNRERGNYEAFLAAEAALKSLGETQQQQQRLLHQQQQVQQALSASQAELLRLEAQLDQFAAAEQSLATIAPQITEQLQLEANRTELQKKVQEFANSRFQQKKLTEQQTSIDQELLQIEATLKRLDSLQAHCDRIPELEQQQTRIQEQLSRVEAARQFEQELNALAEKGKHKQDAYRQQVKDALATLESWGKQYEELTVDAITPIKSALFQGGIITKETLSNINSILTDLTAQTDKIALQKQQKALKAHLQKAYTQKAELAGRTAQEHKQAQLESQQNQIKQQLDELSHLLGTEAEISKALKDLDNKLKQLDNPRGKQQILERTLQQKETIQKNYKTLEVTRTSGMQQLESIAIQLNEFSTLDSQLKQQQQLKQTHQPGYLLYLQNQQSAKNVKQIEADSAAAIAARKQTESEKAKIEKALAELTASFDPEAYAIVDRQYGDLASQAERLKGSLPQLKQRLDDFAAQINQLKATADKRDKALSDIKQRERIKRFVNYARKVYKAAGPKITERYVHNISREADRLFRELLGRANVALTWSADYEITVQEGAYTRRFINLSGGEQMCAALAVRLALLKILADIDVAFFDEPTTNMDQPRRASLAEAIARIKSFKQLFVISHDDTFEQVTETVITVERAG
ncbi:MAG: SMC family ATPase [Cyanobacteria bacterium J06632_3]